MGPRCCRVCPGPGGRARGRPEAPPAAPARGAMKRRNVVRTKQLTVNDLSANFHMPIIDIRRSHNLYINSEGAKIDSM